MDEQTQIEALAASPEVELAPREAEEAPAGEAPVEELGRVMLRECEDGQRVRGVYAVRERELRRKRNGDPWLRLRIGDASGTAEAVAWEEAEELYAHCEPGTAVFLTG